MSNLYSLIQVQLQKTPDRVVLIAETGEEITARQLDQRIGWMANVLSECEVRVGDRVSVQSEKSWLNVVLYLAVLRVGAVYLPLNTAYTDPEIEYFLSDADSSLHVCSSSRSAHFERLSSLIPGLEIRTLDLDEGTFWDQYKESEARGLTQSAIANREKSDLASILYTSGTTGKPKGAMISHGNLISNAAMLTEAWSYSEEDVLLHALPLFHVHGLFVSLNLALINGGPIILVPKFEPTMVLNVLPDATVMMGVPTYYTRLLLDDRFTREISRHIRLFISGSAPLLVETSNAFFDRTGQRILERYGMTETGMSCSNPLHGDRRAGSVGPPLPGVEIRVVDDQGREVPRGEIGTLEVRGDHVFSGYWNLPEKTASEFEDGWFITGDMAIQSVDNYVSIVGRGKDLIISGGLNVYPKEIEDVLNDLDGVNESAVVGVSHPDFGEGIVAILVGAGTLDVGALETSCRTKLAGFKIPKRWHQVEQLPRNTMGKVQKNILRDEYKASFE